MAGLLFHMFQPTIVTTSHPEPLLALEHAQKSFGAVHALEDGDIELFPG